MKLKDEIIKLKNENQELSYRKIALILNCSKSLVEFHLNENSRNRSKNRVYKTRSSQHSYVRKIETFLSTNIPLKTKKDISKSVIKAIGDKISDFCRNRTTKKRETVSFTSKDVIAKFGENPKCYLTGKPIDLSKSRSYNFDHIIPASKGGTNTLDNLGICIKEANIAKSDLSYDDFIQLCRDVINHHDKK